MGDAQVRGWRSRVGGGRHTPGMRLLLADPPASTTAEVGAELDEAALIALYAAPTGAASWFRSNFAMSVDGAITGADGRSGSVNSAADHVVFEVLRGLSDVVVVGAGTARSEGYTALEVPPAQAAVRAAAGVGPTLPLVVVSGRGHLPDALVDAEPGAVLMATTSSAEGLAATREALGEDHVLVCGRTHVGHDRLVAQLHERHLRRVLTEGGPHLLASFVDAGVVDELCVSVTPRVVGGDGPRMTAGPALRAGFRPRVLVEEDGTVMGRWIRES